MAIYDTSRMIRCHFKKNLSLTTCILFLASTSHAEEILIPELVFEADCHFLPSVEADETDEANDKNHQKLKSALVDAVEFAEAYQGQMVYVRFWIDASNSAGACDMYDLRLQPSTMFVLRV